jgi:hypothetical protein
MQLDRLRDVAILAVIVVLPALTCTATPGIDDLFARVDALEVAIEQDAGARDAAVDRVAPSASRPREFVTARLLTAGREYQILVGEAETGRGHDAPVWSVAFSIDD